MTRFRRRPKQYRLIESASGHESVKSDKPRIRWEEHVQKPVVKMLAQIEAYTRSLTFFHVPNQLAGVSKALRVIYAALGLRAGVPDLVVPISGGRILWFEIKHQKPEPPPRFKKDGTPMKRRARRAKKTSDDQDIFHAILRRLGHVVYVITAPNGAEASKQVQAILQQHGIVDFRLKHVNQDKRYDWAVARSILSSVESGHHINLHRDSPTFEAALKAIEICERLGLQS